LDFQGIGVDVESNPIGNIIEVEGATKYTFKIKTTENTNLS
jgi:hypothetical protein